NLGLNFHRIGTPGPAAVDNVGIVTFNALRDEQDAGKLQVFVRVLNFRPEPVNARLRLEVRIAGRQDFTIHERPLAIQARTVVTADPEKGEPASDRPGEAVAVFPLSDVDDGTDVVLHARLLNLHDQLPLDDEAWLALGVTRKARV